MGAKAPVNDQPLPLYIFNPHVSLHGKKCENPLFHIQPDIPLRGKRILTLLENALVKIQLVTYLPNLCKHLLEGDPELEAAIGPRCIRGLVHLIKIQRAWNESKSGRIPRSWSPTILLMEKRLSDKSDLNSTRLIGNAGMKHGRRQVHIDKTNNVATFGSKIHVSNLTGSTLTVSGKKKDKKEQLPARRSTHDEKQGNRNKLLLNSEIKGEKQLISKMLEKDGSKLTFLWDLLAWGRDVRDEHEDKLEIVSSRGPNASQQVDALAHHHHQHHYHQKKIKTCQEDEKRTNRKTNKVNILGLIRAALNSKYEDHVKKALKEKDLKSLFCILSLLSGPNDIPFTSSVWNQQQSANTTEKTPRHKSLDAIKAAAAAVALTHHAAPKKNKHHKIACRRYVKPHTDEYIMTSLNQPDDGITQPSCNQSSVDKPFLLRSCQEDYDAESNLAVLFHEDHSSDLYQESLDTDTNIQNEIWGILNKDNSQSNEPDADPLFLQEDTLDFDSNLVLLDATDNIETEIFMDSKVEASEELSEEPRPPVPSLSVTKIVKIPYLSSSSFADTDITSSEEFNGGKDGHLSPERMQVQPVRMLTPVSLENDEVAGYSESVHVIKERLSTQQEVTEDSRLESTFRLNREPAEKMVEQMGGKGSQIEEVSASQAHLKVEIGKAYRNAINLLLNNYPSNWIEKRLKPRVTSTDGMKHFQKYFLALIELIQCRLATSVEEDLISKRDLQERWKNERRNLLEVKKLQVELKELESIHIPKMLTLDFQIRILNSRLRKISKEIFQDIRQVLRDTELNAAIKIKEEEVRAERMEKIMMAANDDNELVERQIHTKDDKLQLLKRDHNDSLRQEIVRYDDAIFMKQKYLDDTIQDTYLFKGKVSKIQEKFKSVESDYIDMLAEKKLKQILRNMEMADEFKRNRAAQKIQDCWKRYKIRKRKRERKKARKGGKKKGGGTAGKSKASSVRDSESPPSRIESKSKPTSAKSKSK